jgi:hypothetical protein
VEEPVVQEVPYVREPEPVTLKEGERIFGEDELLGGPLHNYEACTNPSECEYHKEEYL